MRPQDRPQDPVPAQSVIAGPQALSLLPMRERGAIWGDAGRQRGRGGGESLRVTKRRPPADLPRFKTREAWIVAQRIRGRMSGVARRRRTKARDADIRRRWHFGEGRRSLAERFGLHETTIWRIVRGRAWLATRRKLVYPFWALRQPVICQEPEDSPRRTPIPSTPSRSLPPAFCADCNSAVSPNAAICGLCGSADRIEVSNKPRPASEHPYGQPPWERIDDPWAKRQ